MLLLSTVSLQFNIAFSSFYKSAEACSVGLCRLPLETVETNENEMKKWNKFICWTSSLFSNLTPPGDSFSGSNKWKLLGAKYGACCNSSQPISSISLLSDEPYVVMHCHVEEWHLYSANLVAICGLLAAGDQTVKGRPYTRLPSVAYVSGADPGSWQSACRRRKS